MATPLLALISRLSLGVHSHEQETRYKIYLFPEAGVLHVGDADWVAA